MRRMTTFPARGHNAMASWQKATPFWRAALNSAWITFAPFTPGNGGRHQPGSNSLPGPVIKLSRRAGKTGGENE